MHCGHHARTTLREGRRRLMRYCTSQRRPVKARSCPLIFFCLLWPYDQRLGRVTPRFYTPLALAKAVALMAATFWKHAMTVLHGVWGSQ